MLKRNFSFSLEVRPWIALGGMENLFSPYPERIQKSHSLSKAFISARRTAICTTVKSIELLPRFRFIDCSSYSCNKVAIQRLFVFHKLTYWPSNPETMGSLAATFSNSDQTTDSAAKFVPRCKLCLKLDLQGVS